MTSNLTPEQIAKMDADQLRAMLLGQIQINTELSRVIQSNESLIKEQAITIKYQETVLSKVTLELALHKRLQFSKKTESLTAEQRHLFDETMDGDIAQIEQEELDKLPEQDKEVVTRSLKPKRKPLPPELPRTEIRHEPESTQCKCGCQLKRIGEDVAEKLDYQPGTFSVERHIRGKWVCDTCETLNQAPVPAHVIDKGMATTNLLAQVLINKFADHLPLYRQEQMFDRTGYKLSASTMGSWVGQCGAALQPLVDALRTEILKQGVLHADETPITMLCAKQALKTGSASKKAYLWAYATTQHADIKAVVFDFAEGRSGQHAKAFLEGWSGTLICDDYQGYKALIKDNQITEAACMAHARRKFFELFAANKSHIAQAALEQFNAIYAVEAQLQDMPPDERRHRRQTDIKPLMDKLRQWLLDHKIKVPDGSGTMKAIDYSLKRWDALCTFINDPHTPIDNNWVENQIRPIAVGRKNWLFAGSLRSGQRNAAIMSLVQSAKLNGLNPLEYLKDVMDRLPTQPYSKINELLPYNWKLAN
ncbi:MAG: IS66 family transposase [Gammaproteobacteria bacterium]|nr:IS66 family transposase [Gammaproteobacteria bacterium]MBU2680666.1 IS66 family transposase [Gammaproteobacteria bacterium]